MKLLDSFRYAFAGLRYLLRTQRNAWIELIVGLLACALAGWLDISRVEWAVLILTVSAVLILETINTSIEFAVDLACPQRHPKAKIAKDLAAAAVLLAALASVIIGLVLLLPPLLRRFATT